MSFEVWISFVVLTGVAVVTPGPAILLVISHASRFGVRQAVFPILGNITGLAILMSLTSFGVGTVLETSSQWFFWLRIVGGLYLVYLGVRLLRTKVHTRPQDDDEQRPMAAPSKYKSYLQGVVVALSNPKALLFIGALFPQFIDISRPVWDQLAILGVTLMTMSFCGLIAFAALSGKLVGQGGQAVYGKINKMTGGLFVIFGLALAASSR
ncbi:MAG: LysE family translocator [Magnetovibrio sp.]|nr:LysE family translocator [Magnetovibrio sp.]